MSKPRLRELRDGADLTRAEIAVNLDVDPSTVWRWETGRSAIPDPQKHRLAQLLGTSIAELMGWEVTEAA